MPEIKNTFTKGKMNLDLDERLVPKGEYKEALNIQVSTSDESDVGTVQNILGNTSLENFITDSSSQCIGSISDEKNNRLFWFITNDTDSAIIEYNVGAQTATPILVDSGNSVLEFNTGNQITGINVVDDFLFWTDGENEPKKINIEEFRNNGHTDLTVPSGLFVNGQRARDFIETFTTDIFSDTSNGKDTFILTGVGTSDNKLVKVGDVLYSLETGTANNPISNTHVQSAVRTVIAVDYSTSKVTLNETIYNGTGQHYIGNKLVFTRDSILKKEDITVIKRRPTQAPRMELVPLGGSVLSGTGAQVTQLNGQSALSFTGAQTGDSVTISVLLENILIAGQGAAYDDGSGGSTYVDITGISNDLSGATGSGNETCDWEDGVPLDIGEDDTILLSDPANPGVLPNNTQVVLLVDSISYSNIRSFTPCEYLYVQEFTCTIISIDSSTPNINDISYNYQLQDLTSVLFEKTFPRFSCRYKYQDGEYSAFGPFTQAAFLPGQFNAHPTREPYNTGMETRVKEIILKDFVTHDIPKDVVEIDLLYKSDDSIVVYSIDTIKSTDTQWGENDRVTLPWDYYNIESGFIADNSNSGLYTINSSNIHAALPANQLLRPWDNVPKRAKAQDFTANRLIYGNYVQNLELGDYINKFTLSSEERKVEDETINFEKGQESIKSDRNYQAGIVFGDEYGRETPVLTGGKNSGFYLRHDASPNDAEFNGNASRSNRLYFKNYTGINGKSNWGGGTENEPYYFKVFVKETATEYYNLVMDRVYRAEEDGNLWISFPSSDRNKLQEDDYIILKKALESNEQVPFENKFKVIDIQDRAPEFIRKKYRELGQADGNGDLANLYINGSVQPFPGGSHLVISKDSLASENINDIQSLFDEGKNLSIVFSKQNTSNEEIFSKRYHITALTTVASSDAYYNVTLDKGIATEDGWVESSAGVLDTDLKTSLFIEQKEDWQELQGRFFVKILADLITDQYLETQIGASITSNIVNRVKTFYLGDSDLLAYDNSARRTKATPITNTPDGDSTGRSDTAEEWDTLLDTIGGSAWFVDSVYTPQQQPTINPNLSAYPAGTTTSYGGSGYDAAAFNSTASPTQSEVDKYGGFDVSLAGGLFKAGNHRFGGTIDSLEGIITTDSKFTTASGGGARMWKHIPSGNYNDTNTGLPDPGVADNLVYGQEGETGKVFMHLSFTGVGPDLLDGVTPFPNAPSDGSTMGSIIDLGGIINYNRQHKAHGSNQSTVFGTQETYGDSSQMRDRTRAQWDPTFNNPANVEILKDLSTGNKFKFKNNSIDTTFTIKSVTVKRLYNHTPWNKYQIEDTGGSGGLSTGEKSVNYFYHEWDVTRDAASLESLEDALYKFAKPSNRRVCYILELDKDPTDLTYYDDGTGKGVEEHLSQTSGGGDADFMDFFQSYVSENSSLISDNPAVWETEPKEETDLDIYYEASDAIPLRIDTHASGSSSLGYIAPDNRKGYMIAPVGSLARCSKTNSHTTADSLDGCKVEEWDGNIVTLNPGLDTFTTDNSGTSIDTDSVSDQTTVYRNRTIRFFKDNLSYVQYTIYSVTEIKSIGTTDLVTKVSILQEPSKVGLPYFNCYSFGNGVESNRIRDDFNKPFISNGVKASSTLQEQYLEDHRSSGLIYSGLYNKNTSLNDLNQFIMAEKITKELLPTYGSIQKLFARNDDLIAFCEDKVIQIPADKDIIFNADGNPQLTASNKVLGQSRPFVGEYGISKNPESFASSSYRAYFTDKQRGAVLRLSKDGLTPISDSGMKDWFRDKLKGDYFDDKIIGSYDQNKECYNLTFDSGGSPPQHVYYLKSQSQSVTVTYKEDVKGWVSFKSFIPESGVSCANTYFTFREGKIWEHSQDDAAVRNTFYQTLTGHTLPFQSFLTAVFNEAPSTIKQFNTLNYDGTNNWACQNITTDIEIITPGFLEFVNKENKHFASIHNPVEPSFLIDLNIGVDDLSSFNFQGIGVANSIN